MKMNKYALALALMFFSALAVSSVGGVGLVVSSGNETVTAGIAGGDGAAVQSNGKAVTDGVGEGAARSIYSGREAVVPGVAVTSLASDGAKKQANGASQVIKAYVSYAVATYACRSILDGGNGQYHRALSEAEDVFTRITDSREQGKSMAEELDKRMELEDPGAQLMRQFDEVGAPESLRKQSCENMVNGNAQRAAEASSK